MSILVNDVLWIPPKFVYFLRGSSLCYFKMGSKSNFAYTYFLFHAYIMVKLKIGIQYTVFDFIIVIMFAHGCNKIPQYPFDLLGMVWSFVSGNRKYNQFICDILHDRTLLFSRFHHSIYGKTQNPSFLYEFFSKYLHQCLPYEVYLRLGKFGGRGIAGVISFLAVWGLYIPPTKFPRW